MRTVFLICILAFVLSVMNIHSQTVTGAFHLNESLIESLQMANAGEDDYEDILNELETLANNPIDLNSCSRSDLEKIPFLTAFQINSFLDYRTKTGNLLSIYELQAINGYSQDIIRMLLPFVTVVQKQSSSVSESGRFVRQEAWLKFQRTLKKSKGYLSSNPSEVKKYPGSPWLINAHYGLSLSNGVKFGITLEKDPGEELFRGTNRAFDYTSAYIAWNNAGIFKNIVVGDYRLAFGQGLTLLHGAAPGKSSMPLNIVKRQDAVKLYKSNDENNFFRGTAVTTTFGKFALTAFYSSKRRDANITDTTDADHIYFSSFQESGYHRTDSEIADEKSVHEIAWGGNLLYRNDIVKIGATFASYKLNKFMEEGDEIRDVHDFSGNSLTNFGMDYTLVLKRIQLFGEASYGNRQMATVNGILLNTGKYVSLALLHRYYSPGYFSMHSAAFSEGSGDCNEEGLYAGVVIRPLKYLKISAYADFYRFPWLKYHQSKPSAGNDFLLQADYSPGKSTDMYLRLKFEEDPEDFLADSSSLPDITEIERSGIRYHIRYDVSRQISMQNRFEISICGNSKGYMIYHDLSYVTDKFPLSVDFRVAWFNTDDYDSRIYAYEQDLVSGFSFSPLYDAGIRSYLMITGKISGSIKASLRYSTTYYFNRDSIGSGYDEISGDSRNDLKLRLAFMF